MKRLLNIPFLVLLLILTTAQGCKKMFDLPPEEVVDASEMYRNVYDADAVIIGIYGKLLTVADRYILLNELRGDLLDVTHNSDAYLKQLNQHQEQADNPYINPRPFYELIVNCNDALYNFNQMRKDGRLKEDEYVTRYSDIGTLRSWLYLQLGIHYGKIPYVTQPISTVDDVHNEALFQKIDFDSLLDSLVQFTEKLPFLSEYPEGTTLLTTVDNYSTAKMFIQKNVVLGDLYLWHGDYTKAASAYRKVMELGAKDNTGGADFYNTNRIGIFTDNTSGSNWKNIFLLPYSDREANYETIWMMPFDQKFLPKNPLIRLFEQTGEGQYLVKPSTAIITRWNAQMRGLTPFDIRGEGSSYSMLTGEPVIRKFTGNYDASLPFETTGKWVLYRAAALHLRFAEAANRDNQHKLAYGLANFGIKTAYDPTPGVDGRDVTDIMHTLDEPYPYNFDAREGDYPRFRSDWYRNQGVRRRVSLNPMVITPADSAQYFDMTNPDPYYRAVKDHEGYARFLEEKLLDEMGLELAFEGYRWPDLIRIARRWEKEAPGTGGALLNKLMDEKGTVTVDFSNPDNWYLPFKWE